MTNYFAENHLQMEHPWQRSYTRHCANETGLYTCVMLHESLVIWSQSETTTVLTIRGIHDILTTWKSPTQLQIDLPQNLKQEDILTQKESWQTVTISYAPLNE